MTLQQLRYVIAVADHGSMNEAAKALFISQPSLSGAVKELEKEQGSFPCRCAGTGRSASGKSSRCAQAYRNYRKEKSLQRFSPAFLRYQSVRKGIVEIWH